MSNSNLPSPLIQEFINIFKNRNKNKLVDGHSPIKLMLFWDNIPNLEDYYKYKKELIASGKSAIVFEFIKSQEKVTAEFIAENVDVSLNDIMELLMFFARIGFITEIETGTYKINHNRLIFK